MKRKKPEQVQTPGRKMLSIQQVAERLGLSAYTIREWADAGKIASHKIGFRVMISDVEVERIISESERPRAPKPGGTKGPDH